MEIQDALIKFGWIPVLLLIISVLFYYGFLSTDVVKEEMCEFPSPFNCTEYQIYLVAEERVSAVMALELSGRRGIIINSASLYKDRKTTYRASPCKIEISDNKVSYGDVIPVGSELEFECEGTGDYAKRGKQELEIEINYSYLGSAEEITVPGKVFAELIR